MFDILDWGGDWLHQQAQANVSQEIIISWTDTAPRSVTVTGSLVDEEGRVIPNQGGKTQTEVTRFMIPADQLVNVPLKRGTKLAWYDQEYELVQQANKMWYYNDVYKRDIILNAKHVSN